MAFCITCCIVQGVRVWSENLPAGSNSQGWGQTSLAVCHWLAQQECGLPHQWEVHQLPSTGGLGCVWTKIPISISTMIPMNSVIYKVGKLLRPNRTSGLLQRLEAPMWSNKWNYPALVPLQPPVSDHCALVGDPAHWDEESTRQEFALRVWSLHHDLQAVQNQDR